MKIVDVETGTREMPVGRDRANCASPGRRCSRATGIGPEETAYALRTHVDGRIWFHTGDIARMDEDGYSYIVQRKKDMIIVDGFNVYPSEVEAVLYSHPAVRLAAVIGIPDSYHGEVVKACIALKEGATVDKAEIVAHCKRELAPFKVPRHVEVRDSPADERRRQDPVSCTARRTRRSHRRHHDHSPTRAATMSGLDFFRKMLTGELAPPPMLALLGIRLVEVEHGRVVFAARVEERFYNGTGVAHGGFAATLLDSALGCAINPRQPAGRGSRHSS